MGVVVVPYVFGLSVLAETLAFLTIGLVRKWGEIAPGWLPWLGGKRIPPLAAVVPVTIGGLILTLLWRSQFLVDLGVWGTTVSFENNWWWALYAACTLPLPLWGPMLLAVTYAYYRRRAIPAGRPELESWPQ